MQPHRFLVAGLVVEVFLDVLHELLEFDHYVFERLIFERDLSFIIHGFALLEVVYDLLERLEEGAGALFEGLQLEFLVKLTLGATKEDGQVNIGGALTNVHTHLLEEVVDPVKAKNRMAS